MAKDWGNLAQSKEENGKFIVSNTEQILIVFLFLCTPQAVVSRMNCSPALSRCWRLRTRKGSPMHGEHVIYKLTQVWELQKQCRGVNELLSRDVHSNVNVPHNGSGAIRLRNQCTQCITRVDEPSRNRSNTKYWAWCIRYPKKSVCRHDKETCGLHLNMTSALFGIQCCACLES